MIVVRPLKGFRAFDAALRRGRRSLSGPLTIVLVQQTSDDPVTEMALGVTIGKRTAKRAVVRSRVRRLLRHAAAVAVHVHEEELRARKIDTMVCLWRSAPSHPALLRQAHVQRHVDVALRKALHQHVLPS